MLFAALSLLGVGACAAIAQQLFYARDRVPDLGPFLRFEAPAPPTTGHVYDANGECLIELAHEYRTIVRPEDIPPVLRDALLSAEDRDFFVHGGVDFSSLPRVAFRTLATNLRRWNADAGVVFPQGGSTITQQLVRGFFLRSLTAREDGGELLFDGLFPRALSEILGTRLVNKLGRKLEEMRLALWLEEELAHRLGSPQRAKAAILARYASYVYLGHGRYGFAAGAEFYLGRKLSELGTRDVADAALLAGIVKSPGRYAPRRGDLEPATRRRNEVLTLMASNGWLAPSRAAELQRRPFLLASRPSAKTETPAAVDHVLDELNRLKEGLHVRALVQGRIQVHSTIDVRVQRLVDEALEEGLRAYEARQRTPPGVAQGAVVVLRNADAAILAESGGRLVYGGRRATYTDFNRATQALRQPGSAMKPFVYLAGFRAGLFDLDTLVPDEPLSISMGRIRPPKWISNYDGRYKGFIPVRQALAESRNTVAVWITQQLGVDAVLATANDLGIESPLQPYPTTALGASEVTLLELANGYRALASGLRARTHAIHAVTDTEGRHVYLRDDVGLPFDGDERALEQIREALRGSVRLPNGTARGLDAPAFAIPVMGKTGTTNDFRDALFVGSTYGLGGITIAVRVGLDDFSPLGRGETGGRTALPIFRRIVESVYAAGLAGPVPTFPEELERGIDVYLAEKSAAVNDASEAARSSSIDAAAVLSDAM